jgi:hypothetical protein
MKKVIAVCTDINEFHQNKIFDQKFSEAFIGAGIWPELYRICTSLGYEVSTGDVIFQKIKTGTLNPTEVMVISDMHSAQGLWLIRKGAYPLLSLCLESPIIAVDYFDDLFRERLFYKNYFLLANCSIFKSTRSHTFKQVSFPCLSEEEIRTRKTPSSPPVGKVSFIAANKWLAYAPPKLRVSLRPKEILKQIYLTYRFYFSKARSLQKTIDLHERRFDFVKSLVKVKNLVVAGPGWDSPHPYPEELKAWASYFKAYPYYLGKIDNKLDFLSGHRFSLCCENARLEGYITEKIIHCLFCGTVPLYLGAPDIKNAVQDDLFIDLTGLTPEQLTSILDDPAVHSRLAQKISSIDAAFFEKHSYSTFAREILALLNLTGYADDHVSRL